MSITMNKGYILHNLLLANDNNKIDELINTIDIEHINDNGILSNILLYFIKNKDIRINIIINNITNYKLMKRDYLALCNYFYFSNNKYSQDIFIKYILTNKNIQLLSKDIDYLINNNLIKLLILLNGIYIKTTINTLPLYNPTINTIIDNSILETIKNNICINFKKTELQEFNNYLSTINYEYILDGCNIILHTGKILKKNIQNLYRIARSVNSIIIIHKRHIKKHPEIKIELDKLKIKYYLTPFNINDDLFIILAFIHNPKAYIISNDKYRDHIFNYNQTLFDYNQFKNYLKHQTLSYTYNNIENNNKKVQSIYIDDNSLIIPHISEKYIKLSI